MTAPRPTKAEIASVVKHLRVHAGMLRDEYRGDPYLKFDPESFIRMRALTKDKATQYECVATYLEELGDE